MEIALLLGLALVLGLVPTGIPSTAVVVAFALRPDVGAWQAVAAATMGLTLGRGLLYALARRGAGRVVRGATRANVEELERFLDGRRRQRLALVLAPAVPGAPATAVFVAAGVLRQPLPPLVLGYALGRIAWLTPFVVGASASHDRVERLLRQAWTPLALAPGLVLLALSLWALLRLDWARTLRERRPRRLRSRG